MTTHSCVPRWTHHRGVRAILSEKEVERPSNLSKVIVDHAQDLPPRAMIRKAPPGTPNAAPHLSSRTRSV